MESTIEQLLNKLNNINASINTTVNELEESSEEDIKIDIDAPKVIIDRHDLLTIMNICSTIIQTKSDNIVYSSLTFISNKTLKIFSTNELSQFISDIKVIGENSLDLVFSIPLVILQRLTKLMGKKVMFFISDNKLYIRLLSGDLLLDLRIPNEKLLRLPISDSDINESFEIPVNSFGRVITSILPLLSTEIRTDARKILFLGEKSYYLSPYYYIESYIKTPCMSLRMKDAEVISKIAKNYQDKNFLISTINSTIPRIKLKIDNITYIFISGNASMDNVIDSQISKMIQPTSAIFNFDRFNKIINLATLLPNSTGDVKIKIEDSSIYIYIISNSGESKFNIPCEILNTESSNKLISLCAEPLKKLLISFNNSSKIGIAITDFGIILENEGIRAILMHND